MIIKSIVHAVSAFETFLHMNAEYHSTRHGDGELLIFLPPYTNTIRSLWLVACGMICNAYCKTNVSFLVNDCWDTENNIFDFTRRKGPIEKILGLYRYAADTMGFEFLYLSGFEDAGPDTKLLDRAAHVNAMRMLHSSYKSKGFWKAYDKWKSALAPCAGRLEGYARENNWFSDSARRNRIWIPSGTFYEQKLVYDFAKKYNLPTITSDYSGSGRGNMYDTRGNAAHMPDIHATYLAKKGTQALQRVSDEMKDILATRIAGKKDSWLKGMNLQASEHKPYTHDYIILPNIEWDGAAIATHGIFRDDEEWITETIRFLLENTSCSVAIRQHPASRIFEYTYEPMGYYLAQFADSPRFTWYSAFDEVNTYDIVKDARCVIVNTSTAGIECAYLGKRVITESNSFYSDSGFVTKCTTKQDYFDELLREPESSKPVSDEDKQEALAYYGLRACCTTIAPAFSTSSESMETWSKMKIRDIYADKEVKLFLDGICSNTPLPEILLALRYGGTK